MVVSNSLIDSIIEFTVEWLAHVDNFFNAIASGRGAETQGLQVNSDAFQIF
jgi:hypothetical protein